MAVRLCRRCPTKFSADLVRCPRCTYSDFDEEAGDMPKTTVHGGASNKASVWVYASPRTEVPKSAPPDSDDVPADEGGEPYEEWSNAELRDELKERGLPVSGNKDELVARLEEDDATEDESE